MTITDAKSMALEMFKGEIPCYLSVTGECDKRAEYLVAIAHLGADCGKLEPNPFPACSRHADMFKASLNPFWKTYLNAPSIDCEDCGIELGLGGIVMRHSYDDVCRAAPLQWAETIDSDDGGQTVRIPGLADDGTETGGILVRREDAATLAAMLTGFAAHCHCPGEPTTHYWECPVGLAAAPTARERGEGASGSVCATCPRADNEHEPCPCGQKMYTHKGSYCGPPPPCRNDEACWCDNAEDGDAELLRDPVLKESLEQMRRGELLPALTAEEEEEARMCDCGGDGPGGDRCHWCVGVQTCVPACPCLDSETSFVKAYTNAALIGTEGRRWHRYRNPPGVIGFGIDRRGGWHITIGPWCWTTETT